MYTVTKDGKTFEEWEAEINAYTFRDIYKEIMKRVYPDSEILDDSWKELDGEKLYDRFRPFQNIGGERLFTTKLPWSDIVDEMDALKAEELSGLTSEFDFAQRDKDFTARLKNIKHWKASADDLGLFSNFTNFELVKKKIIKDNMETELAALESKDSEVDEEVNIQAGVDQMLARQTVGNRIIATIAYMNVANNITAEQIAVIYSNKDIQEILTLLQTGALHSAKAQVLALNLNVVQPIDESYRTRIVAMIDAAVGI